MSVYDYLTQAPVASAIFLMTLITSIYDFTSKGQITYRFAFWPWQIKREHEYWRFATSALVHGGWAHLAINMLVFYFFAFKMEMTLLQSSWQFLLVYLGANILSSVYSFFKHKDDAQYRAVGASGAISGILFGFILFEPTTMLYIWGLFPLPAWLFGLLYLVYSAYAGARGRDNVGHDAHFWGAISGMLLVTLVKPTAATGFFDWMTGWM